jgi:hypothetical protein
MKGKVRERDWVYVPRDLPTPLKYEWSDKTVEAARAVERVLNIMDATPAHELAWALACEHRTLQQNLMRDLVIPLLRHWRRFADEDYFDDRNAGTVRAATAMLDAYEDWIESPEPSGLPTI